VSSWRDFHSKKSGAWPNQRGKVSIYCQSRGKSKSLYDHVIAAGAADVRPIV